MLDFFAEQPPVSMSMLQQNELAGYHWSTHMSGVAIPETVASALEERWADEVGAGAVGHPDENESDETLPEGALSRVYVSRYERNPKAKQACLARYGCACSVCGMTFAQRYGPQAYGFIEVHHLRPIHEFGEEHEVTPEADLRPVCPNCHRFIHLNNLGKLPLTIDQAKQAFLKNQSGSKRSPSSARIPGLAGARSSRTGTAPTDVVVSRGHLIGRLHQGTGCGVNAGSHQIGRMRGAPAPAVRLAQDGPMRPSRLLG